jgi:predicted RNase H-like nuclease (RuvC/YqgF family)
MEIVSVTTALTGATIKICDSILKFYHDVRSLPATIQSFKDNIENLKNALSRILDTLNRREHRYSFEIQHFRDVHRIIASCETELKTLTVEVPELANDARTWAKVVKALELNLNRDIVTGVMTRLTSLTQVRSPWMCRKSVFF